MLTLNSCRGIRRALVGEAPYLSSRTATSKFPSADNHSSVVSLAQAAVDARLEDCK